MMDIKKHAFIFCLMLIACSSCSTDQTKVYKKQIIGEWFPVDTIDLNGYEFREDNLCENKLGYFNLYKNIPEIYRYDDDKQGIAFSQMCYSSNPNDNPPKDTSCYITVYWQNVTRYYGNTTFYNIENDSLKIFNPAKNIWDKAHIQFSSPDYMTLSSNNDSVQKSYIRKIYPVYNEPIVDQICFYLPITAFDDYGKYILINRNKELIYSDGRSRPDLVKSILEDGEFERIERSFQKAGLEKIMRGYVSRSSSKYQESFIEPKSSPSISFIKGNKITTIGIPEGDMDSLSNTKEFLWAFLYNLYGYDNLHFKSCGILDYYDLLLFPQLNHAGFCFQKNDSLLALSGSERYYLRILLSRAQETNEKFIPLYQFKESVSDTKSIQTDGQFFTCEKEGKTVTVDIGFNFIKDNKLDQYFDDIDNFTLFFTPPKVIR